MEEAVALFDQFKEMGKSMIPQLNEAVKAGLEVQFRVEGNRFFVDLVIGGLLGSVILENAHKVNFDALKYGGFGSLSIASKISPLDLLGKSFEEIIKNACHVAINGNATFVNVKAVFQIVSMILQGLGGKKTKKLDFIVNIVNAFTYTGFNVKYSPEAMFNAIKDTINLRSSQTNKFGILTEKFQEKQLMFNAFVDQGKQMAMFVADYAGIIKNLNLDDISVNINFPVVKTFFKIYLSLTGLTKFINETILG